MPFPRNFTWHDDITKQIPHSCAPLRLSWDFSGEDISLDFTLSKVDLDDHGASPTTTISADASAVTEPPIYIATGIQASELTYLWPQLFAFQGWYSLQAKSPGDEIQDRFGLFWVWNDTDSCFITRTTTSSSSSTSPFSSTPSSTTITKSTSSSTSTPVQRVSQSANDNTMIGIISGSVIGGGALIAAFVYLLFFLRKRNRNKRLKHKSTPSVTTSLHSLDLRAAIIDPFTDRARPQAIEAESSSGAPQAGSSMAQVEQPEGRREQELVRRVTELEQTLRQMESEVNPPDYATEVGRSSREIVDTQRSTDNPKRG